MSKKVLTYQSSFNRKTDSACE